MSSPSPSTPRIQVMVTALGRWWAAVAAAVLGLVAGLVASTAVTSTYIAETTVSVNPIGTSLVSADGSSASISMPTEREVAASRRVAEQVRTDLAASDRAPISSLLDHVTVENPSGSRVLTFSFSDDDRGVATRTADAFAQAYLDIRGNDAVEARAELDRAAEERIAELEQRALTSTPVQQQNLSDQITVLSTALAQSSTTDVKPGTLIGAAIAPRATSSPGPLLLGLVGLAVGGLIGLAATPLLRRRRPVIEDTRIGGIEGLAALSENMVLDGTDDDDPRDTWDIAAFMLKIPTGVHDDPFVIMVDQHLDEGQEPAAGQELVAALARIGRVARYVDAGVVNDGKISRGWPTEAKRQSWAGEVVVVDTSSVVSDANKVAIATRSDSVLLARSTADDAGALRRLSGLLRSKGVDVALTALFPDTVSATQ